MPAFNTVLFSKGTGVEHPLSYLFDVILRMRFDIMSFDAGDVEIRQRIATSDLMLIDATDEDERLIDTLRSLVEMRGAAKVIVLQSALSKVGAQALAAGADDVMVWPGDLHELALRCHLRLGLPLSAALLTGGDWSWEIGAKIADDAKLSSAEAQILKILFDNFGEIVSRDDLSYALDDRAWRYGDRKFDVHIAKIRKKLSEALCTEFQVETVRSEGYQLYSPTTAMRTRNTG